jgi:short-subunit dehydrogenase
MPTAVITGATSGLGRAFTRALAREGYDVVLVARDAPRLEALAADLIAEHGIGCEVMPADLGDAVDTGRVEQRLLRGPVDLLVNNAGFGMRAPFAAAEIQDEQHALDVMVRAVMRLSHAALQTMLGQHRGDIVNVSSVAGFLPRGTYGASKAWVTSFSAWANARYRRDGVRVLALCPGFVRTEFHQRMGVSMKDIPGWLWLDADDVVRVALSDLRRGKAISVPSLRWQVIVLLSRLAPRRLVERIARRGR